MTGVKQKIGDTVRIIEALVVVAAMAPATDAAHSNISAAENVSDPYLRSTIQDGISLQLSESNLGYELLSLIRMFEAMYLFYNAYPELSCRERFAFVFVALVGFATMGASLSRFGVETHTTEAGVTGVIGAAAMQADSIAMRFMSRRASGREQLDSKAEDQGNYKAPLMNNSAS